MRPTLPSVYPTDERGQIEDFDLDLQFTPIRVWLTIVDEVREESG